MHAQNRRPFHQRHPPVTTTTTTTANSSCWRCTTDAAAVPAYSALIPLLRV
eukprot:TRINITY_DN159_c0_g1_i1.p3 TRINITY_DN159_c0_g1~~TRINITY_DN159_c0_g1_i1.p3  ORF type:complete len:51 (+),score=38.71 TRINITY_DN159_c0_g1_i1:101-253(+)